jgi:hypothetical protein
VVVRYVPPVEEADPTSPAAPAPGTAHDDGRSADAAVRRPVEGILVLPQQTLTQRGQHLLAVADPAVPGRLRPLRPPQRVSPDSLFGAIAAALAATGAALLLLARRTSRRPPPEPAAPEPAPPPYPS